MNIKENDQMGYAPVIIPTLSRDKHLKRCIESLSSCKGAESTDLYISVDFPPSSKYEEGYNKVLEYLKSEITGFSNVYVFYQEKNLGMTENFYFLLEKIREKHASFIYTEDDNVFSPNFLEFINKNLEYHKDDGVIGVSGYSYPIKISDEGNTYRNPLYFSYHGCGMWISQYDRMHNDITVEWVLSFYRNGRKMRYLRNHSPNQYCNFVKSILGYTLPIINGDKARDMDLTCGIYLFDKGLTMAYPVVSKVRNTGYDGSGEDCNESGFDDSRPVDHRNYPYDKQYVDEALSYDKVIECDLNEDLLIKKLDGFFRIPGSELRRTELAYYLSRIFGIKLIKRLITGKS